MKWNRKKRMKMKIMEYNKKCIQEKQQFFLNVLTYVCEPYEKVEC